MKKHELQEFKKQSSDSEQRELQAAQEKLSDLRSDLILGKVKNVREIRALKKRIAQIISAINEKKHENT